MAPHIIHPAELGPDEVARWRRVQRSEADLASPFLTPEFSTLLATVRPNVRIAVLEEDTAGFFAFEQRHRGVGWGLGAGLADCQALVAPVTDTPTGDELLRSAGLLLWRFDHLLAGQAAALGAGFEAHPSPMIDLREGYAGYLAHQGATSRSFLSTTNRKSRKLEREQGEVGFVAASTDHGLLDLLVAWKREQYRRQRVPDVLAPATVELLHRLLDVDGPHLRPQFSILHAGGRPVAMHLGLRSATELAWWLPAYDPQYARYSPGMALILRLAEWAAEAGVERIDLGRGPEPYKLRLQNAERTIADGQLVRRGAGTAVRAGRAVRRSVRQSVLRMGAR